MNFELLGVHKMHIKSVIMFLKYQQEMVDRLIKMKVTDGNDFEWQSKLRTNWSFEDEGIVQCGGWSMNMGYEYLGTYNRLSISPLTERYFVFMASSLREKSSVIFQCIPEHQMAASIVEEMASLCSVPFKTITCSEHSNLSSLTQLLNGVCLSQVWLFLEFMDKLPLISLSILLKEIQLIHQQFATSQFSNAIEKERKRIEGVTEDEELEQILRRRPTINIGIFGSIQHMLPIQKPTICEEFVKQIRTSFRVISLSKPDMNYLFKSYLFMENFTLPQDTAHLLMKFFEHFQKIKHRELYEGKLETEIPEIRHEELSTTNLRTALKLSKLLKDQEWSAFSQKQIEKDTYEFRVVSTIDKFEVITYLDNIGRYIVKQKDRQMYIDERVRWNAKKQFQNETKFQIELDSLKEGFRVVVKTKVLTEWRKARFALYEKKKLAMFLVEEEMIDTSHIEAEIDRAILEAFENSVRDLKKQGELNRNPRGVGEVVTRHVMQTPVVDEDDPKDASSLTIRAQHSRETRLLQRKNSIVNYKFSATNLTPFIRKNSLVGKKSSMKHATTVDLIHNVEREARERLFREQLEHEIKLVAQELQIAINEQQVYNCVGIVETMRRNKGIVITGPQCSGKTQIVKIITIALKRAFNVTIRSTFITPETFSESELYGPTQAFQNSLELSPEQNSLRKSVFDIILNNYSREKQDLKPSEANRLIQSIYLDSAEINTDLADAVSSFLRDTNTRERDYQKDTEFILSFSRENRKIQSVQVQHTPMRFPNGNVIMMPSELYFFFETISLEKISPVFLANVGIVNTQHTDVTPENLFFRHLQLLEKKHEKFFTEFDVFTSYFKDCADKFVINFIMKLNQQPMIQQWSLWNLKSLTLQFFNILNAFLYRLEDNCRLNLRNEDPMDYPFEEMMKDILWNCMLVATTWSFGAVLDKELRRTFEEQFGPYRNLFNITFAMPMKQKFTLFEIFFDVERLTWAIISDKLDYKIKVHFNQDLNTCVLPTNEISQAYFVSDYLIYALGKEKDLNKNIRLVGPQSSSKTVFLNTFEKKLPTPMTTITIPMTSYLTMDRLKQKIEEKYINKRKNTLIPADSTKRIVLVIDDIHLQRNLKIEVLEFIRAWTICRGYFDVGAGFFKKVSDFGTIMAENINYTATSDKKDRFGFHTSTLYCEEISIENAKPFIQTWFTTTSWSTSTLITKYYILMTNALDKLLKQIKRNEGAFSHSSLSKIHKFQYISNFCTNVVVSSVNTEKDDVFCTPAGQRSSRREEDALADIFCYEAMRCFGDRIMRAKARSEFINKLTDICQKEFLCDSMYSPAYIDSLLLGNYHVREAKAHVKLTNITHPIRKKHAIRIIQDKIKTYTGNQLLQTLLDMPTGINDLFRISRIFFKEGMHMAIIGLAGSGKHELVQISAILNDVVILEPNVPSFGEPLQFVKAFKDALKSVAKLNQPTVIQISETQIRDPIYFDYIYTFISSIVRMDECVLFDLSFKAELAEIEATHIRKLKKVTVPDEQTCFKQAVEKIRKMLHIVFLFSDLMTYKETFQLFPQLEYLCEVMFLEDMTPQGYQVTAENFLARSNIAPELLGDDQVLSKSLNQVHNEIMDQFKQSFYSAKMKEHSKWEQGPGFGGNIFIFPEVGMLTGNVFAGHGGFTVTDTDFRQTLFNMPMELGFMGKHRFGMFLEVFRFLYDLLTMHMSIRKAYYETFLAKSQQFLEFYKEVKAGKQYLHDEQTTKKLIFTQNLKKIEETQRQLSEKKDSIGVKEAEIEELREELEIATNEIDEVIKDKEFKLRQYIDKIQQVNKNEFDYFLVTNNFTETEKDLLNILAVVEQVDKRPEDRIEYTKSNFDLLFYHEHKDELCDMLADRRRKEFDEESFKALNKFIKKNPYTAYNNRALTSHLYDYFKELYYKLNIKNTMATTYFRIQEIKMQIDSNIFSVNYAKQSIQVKQEELENLKQQHDIQKIIADKLSRQIEEAQISHMRTEAIEEHIWAYTARIQKKLNSLDSRVDTLLGDSIMMAASVVYLGPFAPEEREATRTKIRLYLEKVRNIDCNYIWKTVKPQRRDIKPARSIFWQVLRDIGLKEILSLDNLPSVFSPNDLAEALFVLLFSPSLPVISDPTGQLEEFVKRTFLKDLPQPKISSADIFANEKVESAIRYGRMSLVTDLNFMRKMSTGLSQDHPLMKRLSSTLYNGFDFQDFRTAQLKKIGTYYSFFSHQTSVNKRVPAFDAKLDNISLYQVQVFQPRFDFLLNSEFLQNSTFISAAPSHQTDGILDNNPAIVELKEIFLRNMLVDTSEFEQIKQKLKRINERMWTLESNFENSFLLASGETLKKLVDYKQLMEAVMDVNNEKDAKKRHLERYTQIMEQVNLFTEVARVIFQIYMALKFTSKIMNETTYSWRQFTLIVDQVIKTVIANKKISKAGRASAMSMCESQTDMSMDRKQSEMEVEIDSDFFSKEVLPVIHRVMMSNVKIDSKSFFNLVFSLRLGLLYNSLTIEEFHFILNQLILQKEFWKWRDPSHQFVNLAQIVDKTHIKDMRSLFFKLYPDDATNKAQVGMPLKVFETINQKLGPNFTYQQLSLCMQTVIREKYNMQPVQMITFGFLCPDHEFQAKLTQFMYTQIQSILDFEEDLFSFKRFIKVADWQQPICMFSAPEVNSINLVTSIAKHYGIPLTVLRTDPVIAAAKTVENLENAELRDMINGQLLDIANIRFQQKMDLDMARFDNMACNIINEPNGNQVIAKQNWLALKQRNVNLDENSVNREVNFSQAEDQPVQKILECAKNGQWVMICPVQFPQYFTKLSQSLKKMTKEISPKFRLIIDFQGFTQNEIPDSILFNESVTFHVDSSNVDVMPSYADIWNKILEENYLLLLTDPSSNKEKLLKIDMLASDFGSSRVSQIAKNMKSIYAKSAANEDLTSSFQQYMAEQHKKFEKELSEQQAQTKCELDEARRLARLIEEEKAKIAAKKEEKLLEQVNEEDDDGVLSNKSEREEYEDLKKPTERTESIYKIRAEEDIQNEKDSANFTKHDILVLSSRPNEILSEQDEAPPTNSEVFSQPEEETKKVKLGSEHKKIRRQQTMKQTENIPLTLQDKVVEDDQISLPGALPKAEDASLYFRAQAPQRSTGGFEVVGQGYSQQNKSSRHQNSQKQNGSKKQDK